MKLEDLPKKNIYQVPEAYFEKLPGIVMAQVQQKDTSMGISWLGLWRAPYLRNALAGFALVLTVVFIFTLNIKNNQNPESTSLIAQITDKEAYDYLANYERLEAPDLSLLSQANTDISHEFIPISQEDKEDILQEVDEDDLVEYYTN